MRLKICQYLVSRGADCSQASNGDECFFFPRCTWQHKLISKMCVHLWNLIDKSLTKSMNTLLPDLLANNVNYFSNFTLLSFNFS